VVFLLTLFSVIFYRRKEENFIFGDFSWLPKIRAVENNLIFGSFSSKISYFQWWTTKIKFIFGVYFLTVTCR
jgi:hypothetical protein